MIIIITIVIGVFAITIIIIVTIGHLGERAGGQRLVGQGRLRIIIIIIIILIIIISSSSSRTW